MAAPLSTFVTLTITRDSVGVARREFGIGLIPSYNASWSGDRARSYSSYAEVVAEADFADPTCPEALAAAAYFGQSPHPETLIIARGLLKPTQRYTLNCETVANSHLYSIAVEGHGVTADDAEYTSDSAATRAEIHSGMVTALNAITGKNYTAAFAALVNADDTFTADAGTEIFTAAAHG